MRYCLFLLCVLGFSGMLCIGNPQQVRAEALPSQVLTLHLDDGFLGRAVRMPLFDGALHVSWGAKDLLRSTDLRVELLTPTSVRVTGASDAWRGGVSVGLRVPTTTAQWMDVALEMDVFSEKSSRVSPIASVRRGEYLVGSVTSSDAVIRQTSIPHGMRAGMASWYRYKKCRCAASPDFPKGTRLLVARADDPTRFTVVRVNDFGPERDKFPDRVIDLDIVAFNDIGNHRGGVLAVRVEPLSPTDPRVIAADKKNVSQPRP